MGVLSPDSKPRLRLCVVFNLPVIPWEAGPAAEAEKLQPRGRGAEQGRTAESRHWRGSRRRTSEIRASNALLATMKLFRQAAEKETLTAALARRLLESLKRGEAAVR